jgi:transposase
MAASPSPLSTLLPDPSQLQLEEVSHQGGITLLDISVRRLFARCPVCSVRSTHVHSRYCRRLRDLPWQGAQVRIRLLTRRFYCRSRRCHCRVFTQRLPGVAEPYGRQTVRHAEALLAIGYALGGEAGHRLAERLGFSVSADTILRAVDRLACATESDNVRVLGVDDWAWRRGHRYGSVLVDLERHQPIDLLPDREPETLAKWLQDHPTVQIISRDRAGAYADGARTGAPDALQVADRFHLMCNLTLAVQRILERLVHAVQRIQAADRPGPTQDSDTAAANPVAPEPEQSAVEATPHLNKHEHEQQQRRETRKALFDQVHAAFQSGLTKRAIARRLGITRTTVRKFLRMSEFPERAPRQRRSELDSFRDYLERRWAEGCHNASQLCRELRQRGYRGQRSRVKEYVQPWRAQPKPPTSAHRRRLPNLRLVAFWLTKPAAQRTDEEQRWVQAILSSDAQVAATELLAQQFRQIFKDRDSSALNTWVSATVSSQIPELQRFAAGLQRDYAAVTAAVEQPWSNGQVEGQVHRLKLLKRQMYGRSGFQLLRKRVLPLRAHRLPRSP